MPARLSSASGGRRMIPAMSGGGLRMSTAHREGRPRGLRGQGAARRRVDALDGRGREAGRPVPGEGRRGGAKALPAPTSACPGTAARASRRCTYGASAWTSTPTQTSRIAAAARRRTLQGRAGGQSLDAPHAGTRRMRFNAAGPRTGQAGGAPRRRRPAPGIRAGGLPPPAARRGERTGARRAGGAVEARRTGSGPGSLRQGSPPRCSVAPGADTGRPGRRTAAGPPAVQAKTGPSVECRRPGRRTAAGPPAAARRRSRSAPAPATCGAEAQCCAARRGRGGRIA